MKLAILALFALVYFAEAQNKGKWYPLVCSDGHYSPDQRITTQLPACSDPNVYGSEPGKQNPNCGFYCTGEAFGLFNDKRQVSLEIYNDWVDSTFPSQYHKVAKAHFKDCFTNFPIDYSDEQCKSAQDFLACTWDVVPKMPC